MDEVRSLGRGMGLRFRVGMTKIEAIRAIQRAEGNFDCFGRAGSGFCDQMACLFRQECLRLSPAQNSDRQSGQSTSRPG